MKEEKTATVALLNHYDGFAIDKIGVSLWVGLNRIRIQAAQ